MRKVAIFCEGQTELIIIRELLLRKYNWAVALECRTLFTDDSYNTAPYDYKNPEAEILFQIINVGNDNAVVSRLLKREKLLWSEGFEKIIALRDMYSKAYRDFSKDIDTEIIQKFVSGIATTVSKSASYPDRIFFYHAIMETEAWFLGIPEIFTNLDAKLTVDFINEKLGINLDRIDPEHSIFHPANVVDQIYALVGKSYDKSKDDIEAIASNLDLAIYEKLNSSSKCDSFKAIYGNL